MSKIISQKRFINEALEAHNKYRSLHGSPKLELDPKLIEFALDWAEHLALNETLKYRNGNYLDEPLGENILRYSLVESKSFYFSDITFTDDGRFVRSKRFESSDEWYKEESNYKYDGLFSPNIGHFTQMVWKETRKVGFGFAMTDNGKFYVVANYYPAGNYKNYFKHNVLPPILASNLSLTKPILSLYHFSGNDYTQVIFADEAYETHNELRLRHGVNPLRLNHDLSKLAQEHADNLSQIQTLIHSSYLYKNKKIGENLASIYDPTLNYVSGEMVTLQWYKESNRHNYNIDYQPTSGHFTQIIWKNTQEVGFGISKTNDGNFFAVAYYYPAGNVLGEFNQNILKPLYE